MGTHWAVSFFIIVVVAVVVIFVVAVFVVFLLQGIWGTQEMMLLKLFGNNS